MHSGLAHFQPMYGFLADKVALSQDRRCLDCLPPQSRAKLLSVVGAFLPYYAPSAVRAQWVPRAFLTHPQTSPEEASSVRFVGSVRVISLVSSWSIRCTAALIMFSSNQLALRSVSDLLRQVSLRQWHNSSPRVQ